MSLLAAAGLACAGDPDGDRLVDAQVAPTLVPPVLSATAASSASVALTWTDDNTDETSQTIERSASPASGFAELAALEADVTTYLDVEVVESTTYYYRVHVVGNGQLSVYSNVASVSTPAGCTDADGDGRGEGCAAGPDCDDADATRWDDCSAAACTDRDGDGHGEGCAAGPDCDDCDAAHASDCSSTTVTPEQFGASPDGQSSHAAIAAMFAEVDRRGGGRVVLSEGSGAYVFNGGVTVTGRVTIAGTGTLRVASSASPSFGLKLAGDGSCVQNGVVFAGGPKTLTITGDHCFVDCTVRDSRSYAFDIRGDYCVVGGHARADNAGYAGMRLFADRALNRFDVVRFESIDHRYKGFVYNGTAGSVGEIHIGSLRAVTTAGDVASDGLLIDSGDADGGTIRIDTLRVDDLHVEGHKANGFKIQNVLHIQLGTVFNRNAAGSISTSSGGKILVDASSTLTWDSMDTDNHIQLGGAVGRPPGEANVGRVYLAGDHSSEAILIRGSGYTHSYAEVDAQSLGAGKSVFTLRDGLPERLTVGKAYAPVKTFDIADASSCVPGSISVAETIGYSGPPDGTGDCATRSP